MGSVIDFRTRRDVSTPHGENGYVNTACPCSGCRKFFAAHRPQRSTSEIMNDLRPLAMLGEEAAERRDALVAELRKIPNVFVAGYDDPMNGGVA